MSKTNVNIRDKFKEGNTRFVDPEWMDEAILGFSFTKNGGTKLVYSAEVCIDLIKRNLGVGSDEAIENLADLGRTLVGEIDEPIFVWGIG